MKRLMLLGLAVALAALVAIPAQATTITFDALGGGNGTTFTSYSEGGFVVAASSGDWRVANMWGNPTPDIFCVFPPESPSVHVTAVGGSLFQFQTVDLSTGLGQGSFSIAGFLGGSQVLAQQGSMGYPFSTVSSVNASQRLDLLVITESRGTCSSANIDNISVVAAPVPLPGTLLLLGPGLVGLAALRRRYKR